MLQLDPATTRLPILTYVDGEAYAIIPSAMASDKRDSERVELLGALQGEVMVFQPTAVRQMSHGGMQVETSFPLQLDSLHDFRLTLGDRSVVVKGRVAHSRISDVDQDIVTYRTGVEFIEPSERVAAAIAHFVDELAKDKIAHASTTSGRSGVRDSRLTRCAARGRAARCRSTSTPSRRGHLRASRR